MTVCGFSRGWKGIIKSFCRKMLKGSHSQYTSFIGPANQRNMLHTLQPSAPKLYLSLTDTEQHLF